MYHVEIIPNTSSTATPGWTYVRDKGFDPAKAAIAPSLGRKRGIRDTGRTELSSRQTNAIVRHLAELDRENPNNAPLVPVPARQRDPSRADASRGTRTKTTSNVRRVLQSQKTFRNYLDDEEAALAQAASTPGGPGASQRLPLNKITKPSSSRRSSTPAKTPRPEPSRSKKDIPLPSSSRNPSDNTIPSESQPQPQIRQDAEQSDSSLITSQYDSDPLLKSYIPPAPSERLMHTLLSEPPLTYNASRAGSPITGKSTRRFCCLCGYWGKIRCRRCHQRTCGGMKCYKTHEESRCGAIYV
ncbi:hypothetical protein BDW59DRAFT_153699 [Aspergillus cavernicola]|uniref:HIT-type domain-containing protein n=1 Tax=Aspergillus cavernicola TaxID=176166 RepID=A0ABR4HJW1_9EURO